MRSLPGPRGRSVIPCFFCNDTAPTEIYTLSLHDALPICSVGRELDGQRPTVEVGGIRIGHRRGGSDRGQDRKSTCLNSSHGYISYAVFCLKKKIKNHTRPHPLAYTRNPRTRLR